MFGSRCPHKSALAFAITGLHLHWCLEHTTILPLDFANHWFAGIPLLVISFANILVVTDLSSKLRIEPETDLGLYLGCLLSKGTNRLHDGTEVTTMTYNMEGLLKLSVEKYLELVGKDTKLKQVSTPSLPEETKQHKSRAPAPGDPKHAVQCPWCSTKFDPGSSVALQPDASDSRPESVEVQRGALAPHAASILMKLLVCSKDRPI